jgi:PAS domain S-box-containing protein
MTARPIHQRLEHAIFDIADVVLLALDREGRIARINRRGCSVLGWSEPELVGRSWIQTCVPERLRAAAAERLQTLLDGNELFVETHLMTKAGQERLLRWHSTPVRDESGCIIGTLGSGTDITEHAWAADALKAAEERMRFALQNARVGMWDMDYEAGVLTWSPLVYQHYGLRPGEFDGSFRGFINRIHPDDRASSLKAIQEAARTGQDFRVEHRTIWPDGTVRWVAGAGRVQLGPDGQATRAAGVTWDLTQQKKLELDLRHAQKLESVGRLAAGIAHEINTPVQFVTDSLQFVRDATSDLAGLLGTYQDLTKSTLDGAASQEAADLAARTADEIDLEYLLENVPLALDRALEGLSRIATIVKSMKEFAHPDRREMSPVDLNKAIHSTLTIARNEYKYVADLETDFGTLPPVTCHVGDINQVVLNIVVNAAHAIHDVVKNDGTKGRITVHTRADGDTVIISISDTGHGIPEDVQDRIFDPFFTTKDVGKGTGQGLAIARSLIHETHGGDLTFETEKGAGTTFVIRLPIDGCARSADAA